MSAEDHARLTELFGEALSLSAPGRAAFLAQLRASDAGLAAELAELLAADAAADTALHTGGLAATVDLGPVTAQTTPLTIPGYRIQRVLGEGGMGTVYAAEQQAPRRAVAIKVLHARSAGALLRFKAEADIMARLDHPGIARVLEAGEVDGQPYLVMEHVDGVTLDRYLERGFDRDGASPDADASADVAPRPLGRTPRLELFAELCDAIHHAHVKGVIHRDLKPANVMVRPPGRVIVLDFGVARLNDGATPGDTRAGDLIGTPIYMSPEQARLEADQVDARSDVYTLGVMLYQLLCGQLPYEVRGVALPQLTRLITEHEPRPLGKRDPDLRGDLEAIASKALRKDPGERYQSAAALGDDVRRVLQHLPVSVRTPGTLEQVQRLVRRRPLLAVAIGAAVIATAAFAAIVTGLWLEARAARRTAEAAGARTEQARAELEARSNQLILRQARAALATDPTEAIGWLATLTARDLNVAAAWAIADEAIGRGVARQELHAHGDEVHWIEPLASLPDAAEGFVTGGYDGRVLRFEAPTYAPRLLFTAPRGRIHVVRPSPDGTRLAIGSDDGGLHVVSRDGKLVAALPGHAGDVQHLAWSGDGHLLVTGDDHGNVYLWPEGQAPGKRLLASTVAVGSLELSEHGDAAIAGDHDGALTVWSLARARPATAQLGVDVVDSWTDGARAVAVDATGAVWSWHLDGEALVLDRVVRTGRPTKRAMFAPGGAWVVLGGVSGVATRVEAERVEVIATHRAQIRYLAITRDGQRIATASDDGVIQVLDRDTGRRLTLLGHGARIRHLAFARDALLSSDGEGLVRRWELPRSPDVLDTRGVPIDRLAASPDGALLASADSEGEVALWTVANGGHRRLGTAQGHVTAVAIVDGTVVTGCAEGGVTFWLTPPVQRAVPGAVTGLVASHHRVIAATAAGPIEIFGASGAPLGTAPGNRNGTEAIAVSSDGGLLASGGQDRVVQVWALEGDRAPRQVATLPGPTGDLHHVAFSPRGDRLFAAGNDGAVFAWSVVAGSVDARSQQILARHTGAVSALAVSPDGRWLASSARDNVLLRVELDAPAAAASAVALGSAATLIALDNDGEAHAVTRTGAVIWAPVATREVTPLVDHGVTRGVLLPPGRLATALDGGGISLLRLPARTFEELRATLAAAQPATAAPPSGMAQRGTGQRTDP